MINEAVYAVMEGVGTPEAIDTVMKLGMNHPMGPLTLADFIGLDVCLAILDVLHEGLGNPEVPGMPAASPSGDSRPSGRKSGQGFYGTECNLPGAAHRRFCKDLQPRRKSQWSVNY